MFETSVAEMFASPMVYGGGRSVMQTLSLKLQKSPRRSPASLSQKFESIFPRNLGGKRTLNWFKIVTTGKDLDFAAKMADSLESETTTSGRNLEMCFDSKSTCFEKDIRP